MSHKSLECAIAIVVAVGLVAPVALDGRAKRDAQFLYVVLTASDQAARMQIMRDGLIVWFDPAGGDEKHFGIKFPVGMELGAGRGGDRRGFEAPKPMKTWAVLQLAAH